MLLFQEYQYGIFIDMKKKSVDEKIDELAQMVARGFSETGTKEDLRNLRTELKGDMVRFRQDVDIMLDRHVGSVRRDYDSLAGRVKKLEEKVFSR